MESDMAFVYLSKGNTFVYRYLYGKRSLIVQATASGDFMVSSVLVAAQCEVVFELPANSLLVYDHKTGGIEMLPVQKNPSTFRFSQHELVKPVLPDVL